ncbi:alpha/beta hydrolase family protein [Streptomyces sp. NPDC057702]|uniref:alpha/beta hydrolase family protein n=1 Tax=unclassified Streptomyces TaxID=2593676 RepID=UPI0036AA0BBF
MANEAAYDGTGRARARRRAGGARPAGGVRAEPGCAASGSGPGRRAVAASVALGAGLALAGAGAARAQPASGATRVGGAGGRAREGGAARDGFRLRLPAPTGPYRIGVSVLHLVDGRRADPWLGAGFAREVMATLWYPAVDVRGRARAPHMTPRAAASFATWAPRLHPGLPPTGVDWAATTTHAHQNASARPGRRPVLLYSPGGGDPRTLGTCLAEELASHGSVVVTIDHPGDASEVELPDGTLRETVLRGDPRTDPELFATVIATRIADVRLVLDQLAELASGRPRSGRHGVLPPGLADALDLRRVGVYGHSAGGTTAAQALYDDRRIDAAVNLEGYLSHPGPAPGRPGPLFPVARDGSDRPLLSVGTRGFWDAEFARSWSAVLARSGGRATWRRIEGATHGTLTDYAALVPRLWAAGLVTTEAREALVGPIDPARSVPLVRHLVRTFFARHLPTR